MLLWSSMGFYLVGCTLHIFCLYFIKITFPLQRSSKVSLSIFKEKRSQISSTLKCVLSVLNVDYLQVSCCRRCSTATLWASCTPCWRCSATACTTHRSTTASSCWATSTRWHPYSRPTRTSYTCGTWPDEDSQ